MRIRNVTDPVYAPTHGRPAGGSAAGGRGTLIRRRMVHAAYSPSSRGRRLGAGGTLVREGTR